MTQLQVFRWRPLTHPRHLWIRCSVCRFSTINEDKHLRGWEETSTTPRSYRCPACSEQERMSERVVWCRYCRRALTPDQATELTNTRTGATTWVCRPVAGSLCFRNSSRSIEGERIVAVGDGEGAASGRGSAPAIPSQRNAHIQSTGRRRMSPVMTTCLSCRRLIPSGRSRCQDCTRAKERARNQRRAPEMQFYQSAPWKKLSRATLEGATACAHCGAVNEPLSADHLLTIRSRPDLALEPTNVVPACRSCQLRRQYSPGGGRSAR